MIDVLSRKRPIWERFFERRDLAGLAAFRILFGAMMCFGVVRFVAQGWIETVFVEPEFFFKYPGLAWLEVPGPDLLYAEFIALAVLAFCISIGLFYRVAIVAFGLGFLHVQLLDVTNYLNHYYLVVLLCGLMSLMPLSGIWSVDARLFGRRSTAPGWMTDLLRAQVAIVYIFAGLAKLEADWLLHAQPLNLWLNARDELPLVGGLFGELWFAYAMSWAGFLYDLTIPLWLSLERTRRFAYLAVVVFHAFTLALFDIGMFPAIMVISTTVFFSSDWPRRFLRAGSPVFLELGPVASPGPFLRLAPILVFALYLAFQVAFPLRHYRAAGTVLWNEVGMRYAWKVMVREKNGSVEYRVRDAKTGRSWHVNPRRYLDLRQTMEMSGQPDLIAQLAHHVAHDFRRRGVDRVEVFVDAWVSLNGRKPSRLIAPDVDLLRVGGLDPTAWILPPPQEPPPQLRVSKL